jgi:hypothetical protein
MTNVKSYEKHVFAAVLLTLFSSAALAQTIVTWDFTQGTHGWVGNHFVEDLAVGPEGLAFTSIGIDPWIESKAIHLSGRKMTKVTVRMKSTADAGGELFYGPQFEAGRSVRFIVYSDGQWHDYVLMIPEPLGRGTRFRLDPAAGPGAIVVRSIRIDALTAPVPPPWAAPTRPVIDPGTSATLTAGDLVLQHSQRRWGDFVIDVAGTEMATGYCPELIGAVLGGRTHWLGLDSATFACEVSPNALVCSAALTDAEGGRWQATRSFTPGLVAGTIVVETEFAVDQDRQVTHLPWLTLFPGLGTFGAHKTQGLFAGLEYLSDEPSSSEADIATPDHVRRVPDPVKITFPLMAIAHQDHYIGLTWEPSELVAPAFDSPDTIYDSGAHVMALTAPRVGPHRFENDLVAHTPMTLHANSPVAMRTTILAGRGATIIPAVQKYVQIKGLPPVPEFEGGHDAAVTLLSHGWLDSAINEEGRFRHAVWTGFGAQPAADAPAYMDWLAAQTADSTLSQRLTQGRDAALAKLPPGSVYLSSVSHVRTPMPPLVFGRVVEYVKARKSEAMSLLNQFDDRGVKHYQPGKADYAKTHFADHANGLAAGHVTRILEAATLSGDPQLIEQGLALLDKQTLLYANTVPRGAQTWEVPLHTPDVLASAYMIKSYVLGYIISGRLDHLDQARYWAWTGVPFVYLVNPTEGAVGPYATIAVLGATNWQAPVWFGLPVQWCGLVYASGLQALSQHDPAGPWGHIAKGITTAGLQMTWPTTDTERQGLLPDFYHLRAQISGGPAINPGTVQAHVPELFDAGRLYDVRKAHAANWFIHAPCAITDLHEEGRSVTFTVDGRGDRPYTVLIAGLTEKPDAVNAPETHFDSQQQLLTIRLKGPSRISIQHRIP